MSSSRWFASSEAPMKKLQMVSMDRKGSTGTGSDLSGLLLPWKGQSAPVLTLVLDIDETLVSHSKVVADAKSDTPGGGTGSGGFSSAFKPMWSSAAPRGAVKDSHFVLRPNLLSLFLYLDSKLNEIEVVFWTNGTRRYAGTFLAILQREWDRLRAELLASPSAAGLLMPSTFPETQFVNDDDTDTDPHPTTSSSQPGTPSLSVVSPLLSQPSTVVVKKEPASSTTTTARSVAAQQQQKSALLQRSAVPGTSKAGQEQPPQLRRRKEGLFGNVIYSDDAGAGQKDLKRLDRDGVRPVLLVENCPTNVVPADKKRAVIVPDFEWNEASPVQLATLSVDSPFPLPPSPAAASRPSSFSEAPSFESPMFGDSIGTPTSMMSSGGNGSGGRPPKQPSLASVDDDVLSKLTLVIDTLLQRQRSSPAPVTSSSLDMLLQDCRFVERSSTGYFCVS